MLCACQISVAFRIDFRCFSIWRLYIYCIKVSSIVKHRRNTLTFFLIHWFYHPLQYPSECCSFLKNAYLCRVKRCKPLTLHIVKVFFASPMLKMWKFSKLKDDSEQHSLSYRYLWTGTFCVPRYPISIRVWGIVSFILAWVFPQPST